MRINTRKMKEAGFTVTSEGDDIIIYPENGSNRMFERFKDLMCDAGMPHKDAEMLADNFAGEYTNRVIWNLMET